MTVDRKLCRQYWSPLFNYCRSRGLSHEDAPYQVQQFFARFLAKALFSQADRERGRFRTFLLTALKNFLANEWEKASAQKRGGGEQPLSLDAESPGSEKLVKEPADARDVAWRKRPAHFVFVSSRILIFLNQTLL